MADRKIVFVNPPIRLTKRYGRLAAAGGIEPPFGLCYLAAVTRKMGYKTLIIDAEALQLDLYGTFKEVLRHNPDYVGITATTVSIIPAGELARRLKFRRPELRVLIGGPHLTALPVATMNENPGFDWGVIGEGEETIEELFRSLEERRDLSSVRGLVFREKGNTVLNPPRPPVPDLDRLPLPAFDLLPDIPCYYRLSMQEAYKMPSISLITSRGCHGKCTFCSKAVSGSLVRFHGEEYIASMIKTVLAYGIKTVQFKDSNLFMSEKHLRNVTRAFKRFRGNISWSCSARIDDTTEEKLRLAKYGGCRQIMYGIESTDPKILSLYRKNVPLEKTREIISLTSSLGMSPKGFFMFGNPLETRSSLRESARFMLRNRLDDVSITFFTPFPGAPVWEIAEGLGEFTRDWKKMNYFEIVFTPFGLNPEYLVKFHKKTLLRFYLRGRIILNYMRRINSWRILKFSFVTALSFFYYTLLPQRRNR
ncbi:MAG TPA: radical SAM protein [bacterium]|nr:radical SAM protein [bacterium]